MTATPKPKNQVVTIHPLYLSREHAAAFVSLSESAWSAKVAPAEAYTVRQLVADYVAGPLKDSRKPEGFEAARRALQAVLDDTPIFAESAAHEVTRGVAFGILDAKKATPMAAVKPRSLFGAAWEHAHDCGRRDQPMRE